MGSNTKNKIFRYLDTNGDGTGDKEAIGDYSGAGLTWFYYEATGYTEINRMIISYEDGTGFRAERYASLNAALPVGILVKQVDALNNEMLDLTDNLPITNNAGWGDLCYDVDLKSWGPGNEFILVRWTFGQSGSPLALNAGQKLIVVLNDDFTGLVSHKFMVQGEIRR